MYSAPEFERLLTEKLDDAISVITEALKNPAAVSDYAAYNRFAYQIIGLEAVRDMMAETSSELNKRN